MMVLVYIIQTKTKNNCIRQTSYHYSDALLSISSHQTSKYYRCLPFGDVHQKERNTQDLIAEKKGLFSPRNKYANKKSQSKGVDKRNLHKFMKTDAFKNAS